MSRRTITSRLAGRRLGGRLRTRPSGVVPYSHGCSCRLREFWIEIVRIIIRLSTVSDRIDSKAMFASLG